MLIVTTPILEGKKIVEYKGAVFTQVVKGFALGQGFFDGLRAVGGERSKGHEELIAEIRTEALRELEREALKMGANAIVGLIMDLDTATLRERPMMLAKVAGTAVVVA